MRAVRRSNYPKDKLEIIVVDSSTDNTAKIAKKHADKVIVDRKSSKAAALNIGVRASKSDILYFLDGDSVVERNTIRTLVSGLSADYPVSTGMLLMRRGKALSLKISRIQNVFLFFLIQAWLSRFAKTNFVAGRNYAIYKSELLKLGVFQDVVSEDINLSVRLYKGKKMARYVPEAVVYEGGPQRVLDYWRQQERWYGGISSEVRKAYKGISVYDSVILMPSIMSVLFLPLMSVASLVLFAVIGSHIFGNCVV